MSQILGPHGCGLVEICRRSRVTYCQHLQA
jgi:hypothetical protein